MAKATIKKATAKPKNKKEQYERFQKAARNLDVDGEEYAQRFERAFGKIVPPKRPSFSSSSSSSSRVFPPQDDE
jgi:hypothetical protein